MIKNIYTNITDDYFKTDNEPFKFDKGYAFHSIDTNNCALAEIVLVKENVKGFYRINNGYFVADYKADEVVKSENAKLGLSEEQAMDIILTTMGA